MTKDLGGVTEEMIEAGIIAYELSDSLKEREIIAAIYLAMQAAAPAAVADGERYREALTKCRAQFRTYEKHHRDQAEAAGFTEVGLSRLEKAGRNREMVEMCDAALHPEAAASDQAREGEL